MDEQNERIYFSDDCYLDCVSQNLYYKGQIIRRNIGGIPYEIVYLMSGYPEWVYTRDMLLEQCWPKEKNASDLSDQAVDAQIKIIRGWHAEVRPKIETVRGKGYKYTGKKRTGDTPSAAEKTEPKQRGKVSVTHGLLLSGTHTAAPGGQSCEELLEQVEDLILSTGDPCRSLQALRHAVTELTQNDRLKAAIDRLQQLRETYELSSQAFLRLEAAILAAQRKLWEQRYNLQLDRLQQQRNQLLRDSVERTIENTEREIQKLDAALAQVDAEQTQLDRSNSYTL